MPVEVEEGARPSHLDWMGRPWDPPVIEVLLKNVASKNKAAASVISASPSPRSRSESSAKMTATAAANTAPRRPPRSRLSPRWLASWAAVKAPTPASVAWHSDSWPAIPVMSVMESKTIE